MTNSDQSQRTILVTGDIVCDCFTYRGEPESPGSPTRRGTRMLETLGGANLPFSILEAIAAQRAKVPDAPGREAKTGLQVRFGYDLKKFKPRDLPESLWTFALCSPVASIPGKVVWRTTQALGYGNKSVTPTTAAIPTHVDAINEVPTVALLDDGNLRFRQGASEALWPKWLKSLAAGAKAPWIVLKTIHPITSSELWRAVMSNPAIAKRTVVVVSLEDLRKGEIQINTGISWERAATDIVTELAANPMLQALQKAGYVVISLGAAGACIADFTGAVPQYRLIFDPANLEGDIEGRTVGEVFGRLSCISAAIATYLADAEGSTVVIDPNQPGEPVAKVLERGVHAGLRGLRTLLQVGHGPADSEVSPGFPAQEIAHAIEATAAPFSAIDVPAVPSPDWMILSNSASDSAAESRSLTAAAMIVSQRGLSALRSVPYQEYGQVTTVDRAEIEDLRVLKRLIDDYARTATGSQPLSVAVFGAPGSGKSFLVKQLVKASGLPSIESVTFNLSQFTTADELRGPLHQVRDLVLKGKLPLVFWDEFDSHEYEWLQHFLMPMQDGTFQEGQITHPIGKCIFIFAGGTSRQYQHFGDRTTPAVFEGKKGPDFISRLNGYLNVIGPNPRETFSQEKNTWVLEKHDPCCHLRRALLLRGLLGLGRDKPLNMDRGLLRALLEISSYNHGARSMQQLLEMIKQRSQAGVLRRSDLPPRALMSLMVDAEEFLKIMTKDDAFKRDAEKLAPHVHEFYRELGKREKWPVKYDMDYAQLPDKIKDDNVAAAMRIPDVLSRVQLQVVPKGAGDTSASDAEAKEIIEKHIDLLAEAEHDGWMDYKLLNGWKLGTPRDDDNHIHDLLIPFAQLGEKEKGKDRNSVRKYPEIVNRAGYRVERVGDR